MWWVPSLPGVKALSPLCHQWSSLGAQGLVGFPALGALGGPGVCPPGKRKFPLLSLLLLPGAEGKPRRGWVLSHCLPELHRPRTSSCARCIPVSAVGRLSSSASRKLLWGGGGGAASRVRPCHRSEAECSLYFLSSTSKNEISVECAG